MVTAAFVLTVTIHPWLRQDSVPILVASLANRNSPVLWPPTMSLSANMRSSHAAGRFPLTATLITPGYAIILTNTGSLELYFRATIFCVWLFYQGCIGSLNVIEARFQLIFKSDHFLCLAILPRMHR